MSGVSLPLVRPFNAPIEPGTRPGCALCSRSTYDPDKRGVPWVRAVADSRQVLICPECQRERADWASALDRCEVCDGTRLSAMLGQIVCRACGHATAQAGA